MREQVQVPFDSRGETSEQEKGSAPKGLNRPAMPQGLEKPRPLAKKRLWLRRRCNCGRWTCTSPGTGSPPGYHWVYFDAEGNLVDARANGLPLQGDHGGSTLGTVDGSYGKGWACDATDEEQAHFNGSETARSSSKYYYR